MNKTLSTKEFFLSIKKRAYCDSKPIQATFEITPRCSFNCRMCYVHLKEKDIYKYGKELTAKQWIYLAKQAYDAGVLQLCITGGDPMCHPEFEKIWIEISKMGFRLILQTPGNLINGKFLDLFRYYPPNEVKITLYGSNNETYKDVCCVENGFDKVNIGIQNLIKLKIPVQLVTTFVKQNINDVESIISYAKENRLKWFYSSSCYPSLRNGNIDVSESALSVWDLGCAEETGKFWNENKFMRLSKKPCEYCSSYRIGYSITWNGEMRFCLFLNKPNINILERTFEESWQELLSYWEKIKWPDKCYTCDIQKECLRCIAHLACYNGGINKLNEKYCQKVYKLLSNKEE